MAEKDVFTNVRTDQPTQETRGRRSKRYRSKIDKLFESDWEVLVVERDGRTGEFRTRTAKEVTPSD